VVAEARRGDNFGFRIEKIYHEDSKGTAEAQRRGGGTG
jgi:hypothetical protein